MKKLIKKISCNKLIAKFMLPLFIKLHNYCYQQISKLSVVLNNGIHPKHKIMNYHQFFIDSISSNDVILDIGCSNGANAYDIAKKAKKVVGIDKSEGNIKFAKEHYQRDNLKFIIGDINNYHFKNKFNKIVLSNVLEHIENRINFLRNLHNLSDIILLRVPMITRDWLAVYKKENGFEYKLDKTHFIEYTLNSLKEELNQAGWKIDNYSIQFGEFWGTVTKKNNYNL